MSWNRKHLLDIESLTVEEIITVLDTARAFKAVGDARHQEGPGAARQDRRQPLRRAFHPHPHQLRAVRAAPLRRHHQLHGRGFLAQEGRDAQGHRPQPGGAERRLHRHPAQRLRRAAFPLARPQCQRHQRRRRRARASHPGPAGRLHHPREEGPHRGPERHDPRRYSLQPRRPLGHLGAHEAGRQGHPVRAVHARAARVRADGLPRHLRRRGGHPRRRHHQPAAHPARAAAQVHVPQPQRVHQPVRPQQGPAGAAPNRMRSSCIPGPINRGVEIDSEIADSGRSVILEQVTNGLAVRMAVLFLVNGGKGPHEVTA